MLLIGPPGAGKSTFAQWLVDAALVPVDAVLSTDEYRGLITGSPTDLSQERRVFAMLRAELVDRLGAGSTTVIDATNLWPRRRLRHASLARAAERPLVAIRFDLSLDVLLTRNATRERRVPPGAVVLMHRQMVAGAAPEVLRQEGFDLVLEAHQVVAPVAGDGRMGSSAPATGYRRWDRADQDGGRDADAQTDRRRRGDHSREDEVEERRQLARHLEGSVFPADRDALVESARRMNAPEKLVARLSRLPDREYTHTEAVWEALGGRTEPRRA